MLKQIGYALFGASALLSTHVFSASPANGYLIKYPKHSSRLFENTLMPICGRCEIIMQEGVTTELNAIKNKDEIIDTIIKLNGKVVTTGEQLSVPVHNGSSFDLQVSPFASFILYNNSDYDITSDCTEYKCPDILK